MELVKILALLNSGCVILAGSLTSLSSMPLSNGDVFVVDDDDNRPHTLLF